MPTDDPPQPVVQPLTELFAAAGEWAVDGEDLLTDFVAPDEPPPQAPIARTVELPKPVSLRPPSNPGETPSLEQLAEAMLFAGGAPLSADQFGRVARVPADHFEPIVETLNTRYASQNRPYRAEPREGGFVLALKPNFRAVREKLHSGPKAVRLSQPVLDVLALIAYRQPIDRDELATLRRHDCRAMIRQLLRVGFIAALGRPESQADSTEYGTTAKFLEFFSLNSLDDLPRLGETQPVV